MQLSVLIITNNEELHIEDCIKSLLWADEVVVVDSFSTDRTVELALQYTSHVYQHDWEGYSEQKNYGHSKCSHPWILSIDADERVTADLARDVKRAITSSNAVAYRIPIRDYMFGRWIEHGSWPKQRHIRLYRKDYGSWRSSVHENIVIEGIVGELHQPILHYSHTSITKFIKKLNSYTDIEARRWFDQGIRKSWFVIILSSIRMFFLQYVYYRGYKDRAHGFVLAVLMAVYHFVARVKLWELWYKHDYAIDDE